MSNNIEKVKEEARRKARILMQTFSTPDGVEALKILNEEFNPDTLFNVDQGITNLNLGRRDVIIYIDQMIKFLERES